MGDHYFLAFFGGDDPRNPEICKSQREITIFLLFWSGKSVFSCFFWRRRPSKPGNLQITTGDHYFLAFFGVGNYYFLPFVGGDNPRNLEICKSQREIAIFLLFLEAKVACEKKQENSDLPFKKSKKIVISRCDLQIAGFEGRCLPKKKQENSDSPLQKSKKIVISPCDLQICGFRGSLPAQKSKKIVIVHSKKARE